METSVELFTITEAARLLRVPESWLRKRVSGRSVPHTRLGKHVRFTNDHLLLIVADGESDVASPTPSSRNGLSMRARRAHPEVPGAPVASSEAATAASTNIRIRSEGRPAKAA